MIEGGLLRSPQLSALSLLGLLSPALNHSAEHSCVIAIHHHLTGLVLAPKVSVVTFIIGLGSARLGGMLKEIKINLNDVNPVCSSSSIHHQISQDYVCKSVLCRLGTPI